MFFPWFIWQPQGIALAPAAPTNAFADIGRIIWRDPAHGVTVVDEWISCSVTQDDYLGTATLTFPLGAAWTSSAGIDPAADIVGNWLEVYYRDLDDPLWRGAAVKVEWGWTRGVKAATVTFEYMWAHLFRRVLSQSPTNAQFFYSAATIKADEFAGRLMKHSIGVAFAGGGLFAGAMYSLTVDRGDAGQFAPWVLTVVTPHSTSSVDMVLDQQSGANTLDTLIDIGRRGDVAYTLVETSTPGTFEADVTATYQRSDVTAAVIISDRHGTMVGFKRTLDYTTVANTWLIKGDGDGSGQTFTWYQDPSASTIGNFENTATAPNVTAAGSMTALKDRMMGLYAEAGQTVEVDIVEIGGVLFNDTFGWRDLVKVHSAEFGFADDLLVVGYKLDIPSSGAAKVGLTLGQHLHRLPTDIRDWQPGQGGRGGGGIFYQRSG